MSQVHNSQQVCKYNDYDNNSNAYPRQDKNKHYRWTHDVTRHSPGVFGCSEWELTRVFLQLYVFVLCICKCFKCFNFKAFVIYVE